MEYYINELNDENTNYFIIDENGENENDITFSQYSWNISKNGKIKEGDLFIYKKPQRASEIGQFYFFGVGKFGKIEIQENGDATAELEECHEFDEKVTRDMIGDYEWSFRDSSNENWNNSFNMYGITQITKNDFQKFMQIAFTNKEYWFIPQHTRDFSMLCYAVKILKEYQDNNINNETFENFFRKEINRMFQENVVRTVTNHRCLDVARTFGLIKKVGRSYASHEISEVYYAIEERCQGDFYNKGSYIDIINQQVEKINMIKDSESNIRDYNIYSVFYLYKIILEIGKITGEYYITDYEFQNYVIFARKYEEYPYSIINILNDRKQTKNRVLDRRVNNERISKFIIENTNYFSKYEDRIYMNQEWINDIAYKVYLYEKEIVVPKTVDEYINLLTSNRPLVNTNNKEKEKKMSMEDIDQPHNRIFFGAPGTGKSHDLEEERKKYFGDNYSRVTFHPNMTYGQFVGMFKPISRTDENGMERISYEYVYGPFLEILVKCLKSQENHALIIEEINRASAGATFGDVFQLLDRDEYGQSEYSIKVSRELKERLLKDGIELENDELRIPSNLYIWGTMNSSDQNVFPLDTAFKRRFDFEFVSINAGEDVIKPYEVDIKGIGRVNWNDFRRKLNTYLISKNINEDKLIGPFFIKLSALKNEAVFEKCFRNKLLMYLCEDVFKHNKKIFVSNSFSDVIEKYDNDQNIFAEDFLAMFR